ncbi:MAG: YncE family protein [Deltaproteobacteria bacterium]|nr:YncE family protein [Deltaproteobacteria bacterium]
MKRSLALLAAFAVSAVAAMAHAEPPRLEVQEVADTGSMPKGAMLSHDGKKFYVTNFGQLDKKNVTVYDAHTLQQIDQIDVPGVIVESALSPDGKTLYISNFRRDSVMFVDLASKQVTHEIKTGRHPKVLVTSADGKYLFAANWAAHSVTQVDTSNGQVVRTLEVGKQPRGMAMTKSGKLFVANFFGDSIDVFEGSDLSQTHRLKACKCPRHLALAPDEKTLYISCLNANQVQAMDIATEQVTHRATVGNAPKSIAVSKDGRWVYSADFGESRSISVVDTHEWTSRTLKIPGMDRGSGVAVAPDGKHALVTGWFDNHVYLVGFEGTGGHPDEAKAKMRRWQNKPHHEEGGES